MPTKQASMRMKNKLLKPVTAAGGVLFRSNSGKSRYDVLLIYRRGVWDLPKGKQEKNEAIKACAVREVTEEIGISKAPHIVAPLIQTYHEYNQNEARYGKTTHWFAMQLATKDEKFTPEKKEGIEQVMWYPLDEAKNKIAYDNLVDVLNALEQR